MSEAETASGSGVRLPALLSSQPCTGSRLEPLLHLPRHRISSGLSEPQEAVSFPAWP